MDLGRSLSEQQAAFAVEYVANGGNATKAAISAGYSKESARQIGSHLLRKEHVQQAIQGEQRRWIGGELASKAIRALEQILDDRGRRRGRESMLQKRSSTARRWVLAREDSARAHQI